jgi:hypothetical protein
MSFPNIWTLICLRLRPIAQTDNTEDKTGFHAQHRRLFHIFEMHYKHAITKSDSDMYRYYLTEEQSYEGNIISIVHGREAEAGYNPEQQNTKHSCVGDSWLFEKMTVAVRVDSQLNFSPICFFSTRVFHPSLVQNLKMDEGEKKRIVGMVKERMNSSYRRDSFFQKVMLPFSGWRIYSRLSVYIAFGNKLLYWGARLQRRRE